MGISEIAEIISVILLFIQTILLYAIATNTYGRIIKHSKCFFRYGGVGLYGDSEYGRLREIINHEYEEEFIQHLRTGYPEIYNLYEEWEKLVKGKKGEIKGEILKRLEEFEEQLDKEIKNREFKIISNTFSSNDSKVVFKYIREMFRILFEEKIAKNIKVEEKIKLEVENGKVYCSLYKANPISPNPLIKDELEKLIKEVLNSKKLLNLYKEYYKLRKRKEYLEKELYEKVEELAKIVNSGNPIEGYCNLCPKVYKVLMKIKYYLYKIKVKYYNK